MRGFKDYVAYSECVQRTAHLIHVLEEAGVPNAPGIVREGLGSHVGRALGMAGGSLFGGLGAVPGAMLGDYLGGKFDNWMGKGRVGPVSPKFQQAKQIVDDLSQSLQKSSPTQDPNGVQQLQQKIGQFSQELDQAMQAGHPQQIDKANAGNDKGFTGWWNKAGDWTNQNPGISNIASTAAGMAGAAGVSAWNTPTQLSPATPTQAQPTPGGPEAPPAAAPAPAAAADQPGKYDFKGPGGFQRFKDYARSMRGGH